MVKAQDLSRPGTRCLDRLRDPGIIRTHDPLLVIKRRACRLWQWPHQRIAQELKAVLLEGFGRLGAAAIKDPHRARLYEVHAHAAAVAAIHVPARAHLAIAVEGRLRLCRKEIELANYRDDLAPALAFILASRRCGGAGHERRRGGGGGGGRRRLLSVHQFDEEILGGGRHAYQKRGRSTAVAISNFT